jgi:hypothetical protein
MHDKQIIEAIPDVQPNNWSLEDGGLSGFYSFEERVIGFSKRDPFVQYIAETIEIRWLESDIYGKYALLRIENNPVLGYPDTPMEIHGFNPSFFFSKENNGKGSCYPQAVSAATIFDIWGLEYEILTIKKPDGGSHATVKVVIDDMEYVCERSILFPKDIYYDIAGWED